MGCLTVSGILETWAEHQLAVDGKYRMLNKKCYNLGRKQVLNKKQCLTKKGSLTTRIYGIKNIVRL